MRLLLVLREWRKRRALNSFIRNASDWDSSRAGSVTQDVCSVLGIKTFPVVRVSDWAPLPFLVGVWRPMVILPRKLAEQASHDQLRDVLIHEVAHIVRQDPSIHLLQRGLGMVFGFHPGVAWLNRQIGRAREELCDNFVLRCGDAANYAQTLLDLSESCGRQHQPLPALGLFSSRWTLEQRVTGLLDPRRDRSTRPWRETSLILTAVLASACLIVGGIGLLANQSGPVPSYARPAAPVSKTSIVGMKTLTIRQTAVTDEGLRHLTELKKLTYLNLCQTKTTVDGAQELKKSLPQLDVFQCR